MTFRLVYIPRGVNAPYPKDFRALNLTGCINPRHAAVRAASFERRSGARVLTVKEVSK
jgi:hypothetical protein